MWKVIPPHIWACFITFTWGVISTCQASVQGWSGMMALRFLLGAAGKIVLKLDLQVYLLFKFKQLMKMC